MGVGAAGEEAGPGSDDTVGCTGAVVGMLERAEAELCDPGDAKAVATYEVMQVGEGCVHRGFVGLEIIGDEEQQ